MVPLPPGEEDERDRGKDGESADHRIAEPVLFLALVKGELEAADPEGYEAESQKVDLEVFGLLHAKLKVGWVFDHTITQVERD